MLHVMHVRAKSPSWHDGALHATLTAVKTALEAMRLSRKVVACAGAETRRRLSLSGVLAAGRARPARAVRHLLIQHNPQDWQVCEFEKAMHALRVSLVSHVEDCPSLASLLWMMLLEGPAAEEG